MSRRRELLEPCRWCLGPVVASRVDARYCSKRCRQAAHRALIGRASSATDRTLRLAYADPPYPGLARRYYVGHPDYAGEVDHRALLSRLQGYDGWALSTSVRGLPGVLALAVELGLRVRVAAWIRGPRPHQTARLLSAWEPVIYVPGRPVASGSGEPQVLDVLLGVTSRPRPTLPTSIVGMKPPAFSAWMFELLGARLGDELDDLFPGSGLVARSWELYQGRDPSRLAGGPRQLELLDPSRVAVVGRDASQLATRDVSDGGSARRVAPRSPRDG